ncbi:MAG TPA: DUF2339 domain-containing protein, partial [Nitrospirota bacterium]|nr:DUF2339 domain-containing protein [Nitrospirota bacterium]
MGHELCLFFLVVGIVVLFIRSMNIRRDLETHVEKLRREIAELKAAVAGAAPRQESEAEQAEAMKRPPVAPVPPVVETPPPPVVTPPSPVPEGLEGGLPPITPAPSGLAEGSSSPDEQGSQEEEQPSKPVTLQPAASYAVATPSASEPAVPSGPTLMDRWMQFKANVDWELFTGVKLFAWLGGLALFIGAGFFVKYSIDRNLIPPALRLAISAVIGLS